MKLLYLLFSIFQVFTLNVNVKKVSETTTDVIYNSNYEYNIRDDEYLLQYNDHSTIVVYLNKTIDQYNQKYTIVTKNANGYTLYYNNQMLIKYKNKTNQIELEDTIVYDAVYDEGSKITYVVGMIDNDAAILVYDSEFNLLQVKTFGGVGVEEFHKVYLIDEYLYLFGEKPANTNDSVLLNVGSGELRKIFALKLKKYYYQFDEIEAMTYLNEIDEDEHITFIDYDTTKFILKNEQNTIYFLNLNLELLPTIDKTDKYYYLDISYYQDKFIYINDENTHLMPVMYKIKNNRLISYEVMLQKIVIREYLVYEIEDSYQLHYDYYTLKSTNPKYILNGETPIYSLLGESKLEIKEDSFIPALANCGGKYQFQYRLTIDNNQVDIDSTLIIDSFINVMDNTIYKNVTLKFLGKAILDNQEVFNGYQVEEGKHELKLYDNSDKLVKVINFEVNHNYYKDNDLVYLQNTKMIDYEDVIQITIDLSQIKIDEIVKINSNKEEIIDYQFINNQLIISFNYQKDNQIHSGYQQFIIEDIEYLYNNQSYILLINSSDSYYYLKALPKISINEQIEDNNLLLNYSIEDNNQSIDYYEIDLYEKTGKLVSSNQYYFDSNEFNVVIPNNFEGIINNYLVIHDGKSQNKILLTSLNIDEECKYLKIEHSFKVGKMIENINLKINLEKCPVKSIKSSKGVILDNINYDIKGMNITLLIAICLVIVIGFSIYLIIYLLKHKDKFFKKNKLKK